MANLKTNGHGPQVGAQSHTFNNKKVSLKESGGGKDSLKPTRLDIATLNIRSMMDDETLTELETELGSVRWDVVGLAETRRRGETLCKLSSGNILYCKGREDQGLDGVGFLVNKKVCDQVTKYLAFSERVALIVIDLHENTKLKIIQVYAPTSTHEDQEVEAFYEDITRAITSEQTKYTIVLGDFNAKLGMKRDRTENKIGNYGYGIRNNRGETLMNYLEAQNLFQMNSFFKKKPHRKWTWSSPDGITKNEIDFVLTKEKRIIKDVSVINNISVGSDHRMVRAKIEVTRNMLRNRNLIQRKLKIDKELLQERRELYKAKLGQLDENIEHLTLDSINTHITSTLVQTASEIATLRNNKARAQHKKSTEMITNRRQLINEGKRETNEYKELNRKIRKQIKEERKEQQEKYIENIIENNKSLKSIKLSSGKKKKVLNLKDGQGNIISDRTEMTDMAKLYYEQLYNTRINPSDTSRENLRRTITNVNSEDIPEITESEIKDVIKDLKRNKAAGEDQIIPELIKEGGEGVVRGLGVMLNKCLSEGSIPNSWNNAKVILLHKKGDSSNLNNYRPIALLSQLYKLFTKIIMNRLKHKTEMYQPVEQAGFRKSFSTIDHLLTLRILIEKANEYHLTLYIGFVDYEKAFDSIEHWAVKEALINCRVDSRYIMLIENIYKKATITVQLDEDLKTDQINISRGVRQGDPISPNLFTLALEDIFKKLNWENRGVLINGKRLNHLRFADDVLLISDNCEDLRTMLNELHDASQSVGLKINLSKTKLMTNGDNQEAIRIGTMTIEYVDEYIYLGQVIKANKMNQTAEVSRRIRLGWVSFRKLSCVLKNLKIPLHLRTKVYNSCILPVLTYGAQTWTFTKKNLDNLRKCQRAMERQMLGITLRDKKRNAWIRNKTKVTDVSEQAARLKWKFAGHNERYPDNRWNREILNWRPYLGARGRGRPQMRWADDIKRHGGLMWRRVARDRVGWNQLLEAYIQTLKEG